MTRTWLLTKRKYRSVGSGGPVTAMLILSACSTTPQQIYHQASIGSGQAVVVIGVAHEPFLPRGRFTIVLDEYSPETEKTTATCFNYERSDGPPESASVKYFLYRVPAGIYAAGLDVMPPANTQAFVAPAGRAVYIGDFAPVENSRLLGLKSNLAAARNEVAELLPVGVPLVQAESSDKAIRWTASRCSP
jgi:hypothetical protein